MGKRLSTRGVIVIFLLFGLVMPFGLFSSAQAEQVRFGTAFRSSPNNIILIASLEERGVWKRNGIDAKTFSMPSGRRVNQALTAGSLDLASSRATSTVGAAFRGVPLKIVADYGGGSVFSIYVPAASSLMKPIDLKGKKIGISRAGGGTHAAGRLLTKALGISAEVKFVSIRGFSARMASLKSGSIDASMHSNLGTADLVAKGKLRMLVSTGDYLPKNWSYYLFFVRTGFLKKDPAMVKRVVSALKEAVEEARSHRGWAKEVFKKQLGFSEKGAKYVSETFFLKPATGVRMDGLAAVRDFMLEYGLIKKARVLPLKQIVAPGFIE